MNILFYLTSFISLAFASDVLEYTDSDFASKAATHDLALIEFFAPWCGHCKKLAPEYERAATLLKSNDPPVPLIKVDCTANTETCGKYGVSGYPTIKVFRNGEVSEDYNGPRDADGIVKYMRSRAGPTSKELKTVEEAEKFLSNAEYGVIGFFSNGESELAKTFQKVADALSMEMRFAHTTEQSIRDKYSYNDDVVLFQPKKYHSKFEESVSKYNDDAAVHKIKAWIQKKSLGLCPERSQGNADKFKKPLVVAYYEVDYLKNEKGTNYWRNRVMKVAKKLQDAGKEVYFAISNSKDMSYELGEFGLNDVSGDKPVVAARDTSDRKYIMPGEFSIENLEKFVNDLLDDKLEPYLKSEPVPSPNDEPVKVAVAKNFDELVNNDEKDVLIEFYAPWCGHCKSLEPKYKELAEKLKDEPELTIAKMDATANDVPKPYEVSGFPTIYFAPKGNKKNPQKYNGGREVDEFLKFLAKESTNELKGYTRQGKKKKTEL
ncbi:hypothetical protein ACJMK2_042848 [Sinanodonta woodiana]|uniref:Protein disulfide-isomerase n=1 Tax=Sinanodonta woodiana TaxID=1069815 RepID=A0ABD3VV37_SINWO